MTKGEQSKTGKATKAYSEQAKLRHRGMFIDLTDFILEWRHRNEGTRLPPEAMMRDFLNSRGWTATRGGPVSTRTVQEMIETITGGEEYFPSPTDEWHARRAGKVLPNTEFGTIAISPDDWAEFCEEVRDGWTPRWRRNRNEDVTP